MSMEDPKAQQTIGLLLEPLESDPAVVAKIFGRVWVDDDAESDDWQERAMARLERLQWHREPT